MLALAQRQDGSQEEIIHYFELRDKTLSTLNQSPAINLPKDHLPEYGGDADEELSWPSGCFCLFIVCCVLECIQLFSWKAWWFRGKSVASWTNRVEYWMLNGTRQRESWEKLEVASELFWSYNLTSLLSVIICTHHGVCSANKRHSVFKH